MAKIGFLFPGQGSQFVGMGRELIESSPTAKAVYDKADEVLNFSLSRVMLEGPEEELKKTDIAQPAILTASAAAYAVLTEKWVPDSTQVICAGHSLGEYSALLAAGVLDFASCVHLVRKRGQLMQTAANEIAGSMAAVIGKNEEEVKALCQAVDPEGNVQVANLNSPGQVVISGTNQALDSFNVIAREKKIRVIPLSVSGPFHSRFMQSAADQLAAELDAVSWQNARFPVIANVSAEPLTKADAIRSSLLKQVTSSVRWEQSMQKMQSLGVTQMIEVGPGRVLRGLMKKINSQINVLNAFLPGEIDAVINDLAGVGTA